MEPTFYIDNVNIDTQYGIKVLNYDSLIAGQKQRVNTYEWPDKSGVDVDFNNIKYEAGEYTLKCIMVAATEDDIDSSMEALTYATKTKGLFVLSMRDTVFRKAFLCYRNDDISGKLYSSKNKCIYEFDLKLKGSNPNALIDYVDTGVSTNYIYSNTKGPGWLHWGDGVKEFLEHSGDYSHTYLVAGKYDVIMDIDKDAPNIAPPYVVPDFDTDKSIYDVNAYVTKPFTLELHMGEGTTSQDMYYHIIFNGVREIIYIPSGTNMATLTITREFLDVSALSYLKVETYLNSEYGTKVRFFMFKGSFKLINAGVTRFNFVNDSGTAYSYFPNEFHLGNNDIPESDINTLLEAFNSVVHYRTADPLVLDISGGTNAVPSSVTAIDTKNTMILNLQTYSDNG
ncbi:MAG: hypothetical protein CVU09_00180 [Bacteroidetes bacterium HGW-Bacteroidetes-4]|jgi:hypothetical protein|nr:MAG: hypothetical protein CVU09_00180 [Bacteroidetes bacterium HGW-Bacteroidetes-4]